MLPAVLMPVAGGGDRPYLSGVHTQAHGTTKDCIQPPPVPPLPLGDVLYVDAVASRGHPKRSMLQHSMWMEGLDSSLIRERFHGLFE